ncbi:PadR family transcriptional regulator [Arthrobacter sp.]|uniref:PadR family transcriptional regulator n=1 Tax=Arthrobacter sp. TaxID=1667 RepID=UPI0028110945|nr:PadR family transcriptional regulator [Arthrobacter sp.]
MSPWLMTLSRLILGLLSLAPMTGYELKKHFDATVNHFWSADKAQIYRTLTTLVKDGLCIAETVQQDGLPSKQVHRITEHGRAALLEWLETDPAPDAERNAFLGRVFFAAQLDEKQLHKLFDRRREAALSYLASLQEQLDASRAASPGEALYFQLATLRNGIRHLKAELDWLQDIEKELV